MKICLIVLITLLTAFYSKRILRHEKVVTSQDINNHAETLDQYMSRNR